MARRKESIVLRDPKALRALAHPARQRLVSELFGGRVLTATEAAELVELTPSAVSHHLRALEKWGLARRAAATGDGRERPWEGTARALRLEPSGSTGTYALQTMLSSQLDDFRRQLNEFLDEREHGSEWPGQGMVRGDLWLTADETREVITRVHEVLDEFDKRRTPHRHPKDSRKMTFVWSLVPAS